jgi:hypothetical protein
MNDPQNQNDTELNTVNGTNNTPSADISSLADERQLIDALSKLFGTEDNIPEYYDVIFRVTHGGTAKKIYACRGVLIVQSKFFANILKDDAREIKINGISPKAFMVIVEFFMAGTLRLPNNNLDLLFEVVEYCRKNEIEPIMKKANQFVNLSIEGTLERGDVEAALDLYRALSLHEEHDISDDEILQLKVFLFSGAAVLLAQPAPPYLKLSREMMATILEEYFIDLEESEIFERVFEWALTNMAEDYRKAEEQNQDLPMPDENDKFYVFDLRPNKRPQIVSIVDSSKLTQYHDLETIRLLPIKKVRSNIADLLPLLRYEYMDMQSILTKIETKQMFNSDEIIEFIRATSMHSEPYTSYSILGQEYTTPRKKRSELKRTEIQTKTPSVIQRWEVPISSIKNPDSRLSLPDFTFQNTIWYTLVISTLKNNQYFISCYLYNREIAEGKNLKTPIDTTISFKLINYKDGKHKTKTFQKVWSDVKAWGFNNMISIVDLKHEPNGWLKNEMFTIEIQVQVN